MTAGVVTRQQVRCPEDMFGYVVNEWNPDPSLTLRPRHLPGRTVRYLPHSQSIVVDLPASHEELRGMHDARWWSEVSRRRRRFTEKYGELRFGIVTEEPALSEALAAVQRLYASRWAAEYTSLPWRDPQGFAPWAAAMRDLAATGRGCIALLEGPQGALSFAYCVLDGEWCYAYQHAASPEPELRSFGLGKLLWCELITALVADGRIRHVDLMLGDAPYKREWETRRRQVYLRIDEPDTWVGRRRVALRCAAARARLNVQFGDPRLRHIAKSLRRPVRLTPRLAKESS